MVAHVPRPAVERGAANYFGCVMNHKSMNIKNVLIPVDFSPPSMVAVNCGIELARKLRATVTLLHVMEFQFVGGYPFVVEAAENDTARRERAERMLSALAAPEDQDDLDLRIAVRSGDVKDEIVAAICEQNADMVVMGTHGRGLFRRLVIGSITEGILRKVPIPVLTVCRTNRPLAVKRLLFATDFSECSRQAFRDVLQFARDMNCQLVIVHALQKASLVLSTVDVATYISEEDVQEATGKIASLVEEASRAGVGTESILKEGVPMEVILRAAEDTGADIIVLPVQHKGFIEKALLGTTAEPVIRDADVPVLCIPINVAEEELPATQLDRASVDPEPQPS
jgi:nucleotide-binding universal stress UspA family protein